ncbi:hypothetical protein, partial [Escherichia coli]|uniref:hypothetical protein n=1 Tax=Escherichia coli TaxID=562 RepID=UPI00098329E0
KKRHRARRFGLFAVSCRMRRERLIRPTKARKLNILQRSCRPDKRSASGNLAFETVYLFLGGWVKFRMIAIMVFRHFVEKIISISLKCQ